MKDWDLAGEKPSFIVVLSKFPHQNGIHWRWPSFPVGFVFFAPPSMLSDQTRVTSKKSLPFESICMEMVQDIFNSLQIGIHKTFWGSLTRFSWKCVSWPSSLPLTDDGRTFSQETCQSTKPCPPPPPSVTTDQGYIREVSSVSKPLQSVPPTT